MKKYLGKETAGTAGRFFKTFTAYTPVFNSFGEELYESQLVRAAVHARANHISKLQVNINGASNPRMQTKLRQGPNSFQTWGQFLYRLSTILDMQNTAFIVPIWSEYYEYVVGVYPILPSRAEFVSSKDGELWIKYKFSNGKEACERYSECGIMTKFQYRDDFLGHSNKALNPTMDLIEIQNKGISEAVKNSASYRFMARVNNFSNSKDLANERKRFSENNLKGEEGGLLLFPNTYTDIRQLDSKPYVPDEKQMAFIKTGVYDYFGVNDDVIQNKAYGDAWSAFYEGAIEPFAIQFSDVMTKMLFTQNERAYGSYLMATANRLQYMTNKDKLNVSSQMADRGIMNRDEIREIWNLPPLPNGEGQEYIIRGEYKNANDTRDAGGNEDDQQG